MLGGFAGTILTILHAWLNRDAGVVVHDPVNGGLSLLFDGTDNTVWRCFLSIEIR